MADYHLMSDVTWLGVRRLVMQHTTMTICMISCSAASPILPTCCLEMRKTRPRLMLLGLLATLYGTPVGCVMTSSLKGPCRSVLDAQLAKFQKCDMILTPGWQIGLMKHNRHCFTLSGYQVVLHVWIWLWWVLSTYAGIVSSDCWVCERPQ